MLDPRSLASTPTRGCAGFQTRAGAIEERQYDHYLSYPGVDGWPDHSGWDLLYLDLFHSGSLLESSELEDILGPTNIINSQSTHFDDLNQLLLAPSPSASLESSGSSISSFIQTLSSSSPLSSALPAEQTPSPHPLPPQDASARVIPQVIVCAYCGRSFSPQRLM
ncbi:hypothetical protein F4777DRAFT_574086 [Nemania sp. FL0916]|nr:hypothetical protein F4777DRAFT_574086 [Nemania sp. FL0916]